MSKFENTGALSNLNPDDLPIEYNISLTVKLGIVFVVQTSPVFPASRSMSITIWSKNNLSYHIFIFRMNW